MYNWKEQRKRKAFLALECGDVFRGYSIGVPLDSAGEVVFTTAMSGYQEAMTDPSYAGQILSFTTPEIGNCGINKDDMESRKAFLKGVVIHELNEASNFRSEATLPEYLQSRGIPAIAGVDTRRLTLILRDKGTQKAYLHCAEEDVAPSEAIEKAIKWDGLDGKDYALGLSCDKQYQWSNSGDFSVVAFDYGVKYDLLRQFESNGINITVVPATTSAAEVLSMQPDGVFLSNGPGDPSALSYAINTSKQLIGKVPLLGIALGHQILSLAMGAECGRLKFGHHGSNHPVLNLATGKVEITSQNHSFVLKTDRFPASCELTHINLNDKTIEGIRHKSEPVISIQYYPGSKEIFNQFKTMMGRA